MIGIKSLAVVLVTAAAAGAAWSRGLLDPRYLDSLSAAACLVIGSLAALAAALVAVGWRPGEPSRVALGARGRLRRAGDRAPAELPAAVQHAMLAAAAACVMLTAFSNRATGRLTALPAALAAPSTTGTCPDPEVETEANVAAAPPRAPDPPGCALVRRAVQLGYARSLGSCAPRKADAPPPRRERAPCTLRHADEPGLHFAWRRLVEQLGSLPDIDPIEAAADRVGELGMLLDHVDALAGHQRHAVAAHPRASHHLWVNLPAPRRQSWLRSLIAPVRCSERAERAPLWRGWNREPQPASALVEDVVALLLLAPAFGAPVLQCSDLTIHWDAPADACGRLAADPADFLDRSGALDGVRHALDRRRRAIQLGELDRALQRRPTVGAPQQVRALVSLSCFVVDPAAPAAGALSGRELRIDGAAIPMRELRVRAVQVDGAGPLDVHQRMARLLAGGAGGSEPDGASIRRAAASPSASDLAPADYLLSRLDHLRDADPFAGTRWPLERADLIEVYPMRRHLSRFIDGFRRRYRAQRGLQ